jgi:hypothetical protein
MDSNSQISNFRPLPNENSHMNEIVEMYTNCFFTFLVYGSHVRVNVFENRWKLKFSSSG